ncbi:MAG: CoB--CoM heterodisulfide reductase subunit C [Halobacteriota archaeon]|nr:CoB--CoM heterodisulfide reductase subunit C [Halobacteriota archaeon]
MVEEYVKPDPEFTKRVIESGADTLNLCFQCGTCTGSCPSGRLTAFRVRKVIRKAQLGLKEEVLPSDDIWYCTTCYTCYERCPRGVDIPGIILAIRSIAVQEGYMKEAHKKTASFIVNNGHLMSLKDKHKALRKDNGLDEVPPTVLMYEDALKNVKDIIEKTGFEKLIGGA